MLRIRMAKQFDIPVVMEFIREYWREDHIMGNDIEFFTWQHVHNDQVLYLVAIDDEDGKIYGTMGVTMMSYGKEPCLSTMMIRTLNHPSGILVGQAMTAFLYQLYPNSNEISVGVRKRYAMALEGIHPGSIGQMKHYYTLNAQKNGFHIAKIQKRIMLDVGGSIQLKEIQRFEDGITQETLPKINPYRSFEYLQHRYCEHPYYKYRIFAVHKNNIMKDALLVTREISANNSKMLRIVDYIGEDEKLSGIGPAIQILLQQENFEYIDFYCYGIDDVILKRAGFVANELVDCNIIPNHFDPYEEKNIEIYLYSRNIEGIHAYLGMGDQDRPNRIR